MKVFVTGGNGFIGSVVVRTLLAEHHTVRCLLRPTSEVSRIANLPYERVEGDVRDPASVRAGMLGCGAIVHLAGLSSWSDIDSPLMGEVVEGGTRNLLSAAVAMDPHPRVVFVSSILAVNGSSDPVVFDENARFTVPDRRLGYSRSKRAAEAMCLEAHRERGLPVVIVNPGEVYGPGDTALITAGNLIGFARSALVLVCNGGTSVVYVDDVALAIVRAMEKGTAGERYILGGDNLTVEQLTALCLEILGRKTKIIRVPNPIIKGLAAVATALHLPLPFDPHVIPYATKFWFMSSRKARGELGVSFRSARATLLPTLAWLKQSGRIDA